MVLNSDMVYCGVYDNSLDNDNYNVAKGFNYHQGPVRQTDHFCFLLADITLSYYTDNFEQDF